jgi:short-subunit dehydrogenase
MDLRAAHVLITGGSKGTGAALARELAGRGSRLTVIARASRELTEVAAATRGVSLAADLSDLDSVEGIVARAEEANGPLDILVNVAAMANTGPFAELTAAQLRAGVHANMLAHMEITRQALPGMLARRRGTIAVAGSLSSEVTQIHLGNYAPAKAGLTKFGSDLQGELRGSGLSVFVFVLGAIRGTQLSVEGRKDPVIEFLDQRTGDFGVITPGLIARRMADCFAGDRARATMTIPRSLAPLTQARLLPSRCLHPLMLWPAVAEARRQRSG